MHMNLVQIIYSFVCKRLPNTEHCLVMCDTAGANNETKNIMGFYPDVFFEHNNFLIIGEAKTLNDYEREHSKKQFEAYIDECFRFNGNAELIIGVPWQLFATAKNEFRRIKKKRDITFNIVIINEFGRDYCI